MTRKIGIVGSTTFPLTAATGAEVVDLMRDAPEDTLFLTRGSHGFEQFLIHAALILGRRMFTYQGAGGGSNFERDSELVRDCDELVAFLDPEAIAERTGTTMLIDRALEAGRPVRVATVADGTLVWAES